MQEPVTLPKRYQPEMPNIPGVNIALAKRSIHGKALKSVILVLALTLAAGSGWWVLHLSRGKANPQTSAGALVPLPALADTSVPVQQFSPAPETSASAIATIEELSSTWSWKTFTYANPKTHENVPAMIIRLPGGVETSSDSYWAFSLHAPYATCDLDYVTDIGQLAARYAYHTNHPMVVAACDGTLYDPLRVGTSPTGAWVRGAIAQGAGIRPPMAIEVRIQGHAIFAERSE